MTFIACIDLHKFCYDTLMEIPIGGYKLRGWRSGDEAALVKYANNPSIWINLRDRFPHPYTMADAKAWVQLNLERNPVTNLAVATTEEAIGSIGLMLQTDVHSHSAEVGYWLAEPYWGRGIMTAALKAMSDYAFNTLGLVRLYAPHFEWNPASGRVMQKAGFTYEGRLRSAAIKDGRTVDELLYSLIRGEASN